MFNYIYTTFSWIWQITTYRQLAYLASGGLLGAVCLAVQILLNAVGVTPIVTWICATILIIIILVFLVFNAQIRELDLWWTNKMLGTAGTY